MKSDHRSSMSPKERVLTALARQQPDRVPINFAGNAGIIGRLLDHFGLPAGDTDALHEALGVDFRGISPEYTGPRLHEDPPGMRASPDWGLRTRWMQHETGGYWDWCDFPLKDATEEEVAGWPMPSPDNYDYEGAIARCEQFTDYAVYAGGSGLVDIINATGRLRSMEQILVDLVTDDPAGLLLIDRMLDIEFEVTRRTLEAARGMVDFLWIGEDLGTQRAPTISLKLFRKHFRPRHQRFVDLAKSDDLPVMIHSCGSSSWAFPDFIEMGINAVDTLQPEAKDMAPAYLKATFGGKLAFHGCISTAGVVAFGSVEETIADVRETLEIMMPGGGYCLSPTHWLQDNSPTENVLAMYETAHKYGWY